MKSNKIIALVVVLVLAVLAVLGFKFTKSSSTSESSTSTSAPVEQVSKEVKKSSKLYVYNWTEYITSDLLKKFTEETGIEVVYSTYESNEEMYAKLKLNRNSSQPYDIVVPSNHYVQRLIAEELVLPLERTRLAFDNVLPGTLNKEFDPENQYSIPYTYGFTTIGINKSYAPNLELTSWADLWKPEYTDLVLLRDQRDVFSAALKSLGKDINTSNEEDIKAAYEKLKELVQKVKTYNSDAPEVPFVDGEVRTGMIWSGSAFRGQLDDSNLDVVWPAEGAIQFIDSFVIPKNAQNVDNAYEFINFLLQPENAVEILKNLGFQPANKFIKDLLPEEWKNSKILFPPEEVFQKSTLTKSLDNKALEIYSRYWSLLSIE